MPAWYPFLRSLTTTIILVIQYEESTVANTLGGPERQY